MIDLGDVYRITTRIRDLAGEPVTPGGATLTVTLPDGSTETPAVLFPEVGLAVADFATRQAGRHTYVLETTDPVTAHRDVLDVREPELHQIISLADAKAHLQVTNDGADELIRGFVEAATAVVEYRVNTVVPQTYTETHRVAGPTVALRHYPVIEVIAVGHSEGAAVDPSTLDVDELGILRGAPRGRLSVTYRAGHRVIPARWVQAAKVIVQHMWDTMRPVDPRRPSMPRGDDLVNAPGGNGRTYSIPRRAVELLEPDMVPKVG